MSTPRHASGTPPMEDTTRRTLADLVNSHSLEDRLMEQTFTEPTRTRTRTRRTRPAWSTVEPAPLTVVPRRAQKAPRVPFVALISLLLAGGVVGLLLFNTELQQGSFTTSALEERAAVLAGREESLQMQLDRLRDPQHIAVQAKKLGMVPASNPAFLRLSDGKVLGHPTVATSADSVRISPLPAAKPESLRQRLVILKADPERHGHHGSDTADGPTAASPDQGLPSRTKNSDGAAQGDQARGRTP